MSQAFDRLATWFPFAAAPRALRASLAGASCVGFWGLFWLAVWMGVAAPLADFLSWIDKV
jgi:hypothetical protein